MKGKEYDKREYDSTTDQNKTIFMTKAQGLREN